MKLSIRIMLAASVVIFGALEVMAVEEPSYKVLKKENNFEIRDYAPHILAETVVEGDLEQAGNKAFGSLFRYISGENRTGCQSCDDCPRISRAQGREDRDDGSRRPAACSGRKVVRKFHDAFLVHSGYPSRAKGPQGHVASGTSSSDRRSTATPVSGARKATFDTNRNWSPGFTKRASLL